RRRHTRFSRDWSSDVCSSDLRLTVLGFDGKTLIHPGQIDACNAIFTPPAEEVAAARRIIAAFELPENASRGAIQIDGRMVERLQIGRASCRGRGEGWGVAG